MLLSTCMEHLGKQYSSFHTKVGFSSEDKRRYWTYLTKIFLMDTLIYQYSRIGDANL